jgi:hypothetical protein
MLSLVSCQLYVLLELHFVNLLSESACIVVNDPSSPAQPTILSLNGINSPFIDNNYTATNVTVVSQFLISIGVLLML